MALSASTPRTLEAGYHESAQPAQAVAVYGGGALSRDSGGEVGPLAASEAFAGFALADADNSAGSAGDINVRVADKGEIELTITGLDDNDDGADTVYATDDNTFTLTASGGVSIGKVSRIVSLSANKAMVRFEADTQRSI